MGVYAETYLNSLKRGVRAGNAAQKPKNMEGQVTEIRPEPKPVERVAAPSKTIWRERYIKYTLETHV